MVESLPCLWEVKKLDPLEAILAASSPICSKGLAAATFRLTVSQPMSAPGHGFWPGRPPRASILLNHMGKDLREIQELLRHKNIRTTVRYTHVGYEQTRQTAEALSQILE